MKLVNNEYQIELDDVLNYSEFTQPELNEVYGEKIEYHLKVASSRVYSIIYSAYGGWDKERQYKMLRYMINNDTLKQNGVRDAIIEWIRGAMYSGMDLNLYTKNGDTHSTEVIEILKRCGIWFRTMIVYEDDDIL